MIGKKSVREYAWMRERVVSECDDYGDENVM